MARSNLAEVLEDSELFPEEESFWHLPRGYTKNGLKPDPSPVYDSRPYLEELGFVVQRISKTDSHCYVVEPPRGWKRIVCEEFFCDVYDPKGNQRIAAFIVPPNTTPELFKEGYAYLNFIPVYDPNHIPEVTKPDRFKIVKE